MLPASRPTDQAVRELHGSAACGCASQYIGAVLFGVSMALAREEEESELQGAAAKPTQ
jgi:hypothetical protein